MFELINSSLGFKNRAVIEKINLSISKGQIIGVVGPNGAGKSTFLKSLSGLLPLREGQILLNKTPLNEVSIPQRKQHISFLEAETALAFSMTVKELIELTQEEITEDLIKALDMKDFLQRDVLQLSSGERKRALLAHTLAGKAECFLLDEPFSHLDWQHQNALAEHIKTLSKEQNTTFVIAAHELDLLTKVCDKLLVLGENKMMAFDTPQRVFSQNVVLDLFAFQVLIDENPIDGFLRLTMGSKHHERKQ